MLVEKLLIQKMLAVSCQKNDKQLTKAIDKHSVVVNVNAENTTTTARGNLYIGGAFSGNTVTAGAGGNMVVAEQEVTLLF